MNKRTLCLYRPQPNKSELILFPILYLLCLCHSLVPSLPAFLALSETAYGLMQHKRGKRKEKSRKPGKEHHATDVTDCVQIIVRGLK